MKVRVFVSYSHLNEKYLRDDSLLGYLRGLERECNVEFWHDRKVAAGELWDEAIRGKIDGSHIALVLVSEAFLTSPYVQNNEIPRFLARRAAEGLIILPVILSACDWESHGWLKGTQFLPRDRKNIESHFSGGKRKELFLEVKRAMKQHALRILSKHGVNLAQEVTATSEANVIAENRDSLTDEARNPFYLTTASEIAYETIPDLFVTQYTKDIREIKRPFNTIIEGQRGTGKTMILRYLALETQLRMWLENGTRSPQDFFLQEDHFVGIYCRLEQGVFDRSDLDAVPDEDRRRRIFEHRLCLFCLARILETLHNVQSYVAGLSTAVPMIARRISRIVEDDAVATMTEWNQLHAFAQDTIELRIDQIDRHLASLLPGGDALPFTPWLSLSAQILPALAQIKSTFGIRCPFFLLFDDFDVLRAEQQEVLFAAASALKLGLVCFKFGIMTLGRKTVLAAPTRTFREGDDYTHVDLDWTDRGLLQTNYRQAVELITERRLRLAQWPAGVNFSALLTEWGRGAELREEVKELMRREYFQLPPHRRPQAFENFWSKYGNARYLRHVAQKKIKFRYAGYQTVIDMSSGIYRQYLEICGKIVGNALSAGWHPASGDPIIASLQDGAIRDYARDMLNGLIVTAGDSSELIAGDIRVTSRHMVVLIESLGGLFRQRLLNSRGEPEIFSFSVIDDIETVPLA
ncbi:MAG TPA: toll/interleukin-1 receptor domain-containing protein, partial [Longimicrobium sp.]